MNKQMIRIVSFVILPLLIAGAAAYFVRTLQPEETKASIDTSASFDLFIPFQTWPNSTAKKTGTAAEWLHTMRNDVVQGSAITHVDINGDGLVDILVHQESILSTGTQQHYFGVLLNRGDLTFDFAYKCVAKYIEGVINRYYGDCAAL